jgi:hypothetical protein
LKLIEELKTDNIAYGEKDNKDKGKIEELEK